MKSEEWWLFEQPDDHHDGAPEVLVTEDTSDINAFTPLTKVSVSPHRWYENGGVRYFHRHQRNLLFTLAGLLFGVLVMLLVHFATNTSTASRMANTTLTAVTQDAGTIQMTAAPIVVDIHGDVVHPGLYHLNSSARVSNAIEAAGGLLHEADRAYLNEAQPLIDGEEIAIPMPPGQAAQSTAGHTGSPLLSQTMELSSPTQIDLNTASAATLETVRGIGPKRAADILAYRLSHGPFTSVSDLRHIHGFGSKLFAKIASSFYVN